MFRRRVVSRAWKIVAGFCWPCVESKNCPVISPHVFTSDQNHEEKDDQYQHDKYGNQNWVRGGNVVEVFFFNGLCNEVKQIYLSIVFFLLRYRPSYKQLTALIIINWSFYPCQ